VIGCLKEPSLRGLQPGSPQFFAVQRKLILHRSLLKRHYDDWNRRLLADAMSAPSGGTIVELGSGGSYLKDIAPAIVTSDVVPDAAQLVVDARALPFPDHSIRALLMVHVFHHIADVRAFVREAERTLIPGGVISMIEVAHTPFARFFFRHFHHERYEDASVNWEFAQSDSMTDSNQALSWIVFDRDRDRFKRQYPRLKIESLQLLPWLPYFASGGVTMRCLVPGFLNGLVFGMEYLLAPLERVFSLFWHIRIRKMPDHR
jgi:SAM-dependent methyltransferase